jgi:hypothetical protein
MPAAGKSDKKGNLFRHHYVWPERLQQQPVAVALHNSGGESTLGIVMRTMGKGDEVGRLRRVPQ